MEAYKISGVLKEFTTDISLDFSSHRLQFKFELDQSDPELPIGLIDKDKRAACIFVLKGKYVPFHLHSFEFRNVVNAEYSPPLKGFPENVYYVVNPYSTSAHNNFPPSYVDITRYLILTLSSFENWKYPYLFDFTQTHPLKGLILVYSSSEIKNEREVYELAVSYLTLSGKEG